MSAPVVRPYYHNESYGVAVLASTGILTLLSIVFLMAAGRLKKLRKYNQAHIFSHFIILLFANSLQAIGTALSIRWVILDGVDSSAYCSWQGAIKQLANVSTAFFTVTISAHLFMLLFLRINLTTLVFGIWMALTWTLVLLIVAIGPTAIEDAKLGPFFGPSGAWCWITDEYPKSRVLLEYMIVSWNISLHLFCFIMYTAILLRVRGNLYRKDGRWALRHLGKEEAWQLSIGRDLLDSSMLKVAKTMVWFPVAFTLTLIPISGARIPEFLRRQRQCLYRSGLPAKNNAIDN
ncbi:hypothetical protein DL96DRAFT_1706029 [Flagelloscypha sp. PMI_526]|nr:hypothetical protein DL96DRAFT_1706029 [Flagelloscypha sp. PMI_526]